MGLYPEQTADGFAFEMLTVAGSAVGFATATYSPNAHVGATRAFVTAETAQVRYRYDGTAPTASVGHLLEANGSIVIEGPGNIARFQAIRTGGTSAVLATTFEA